VDDHSTDGTVKILSDDLKVPFSCIKNADKKGKKYAIRSGVLKAKHEYIITWDADISIPSEYFNAIGLLPKDDLNILPVKMNGKNLLGKLSIVEFTFLETLGFGLAGFGQLVLCYGANLGFSKDAFLAVDKTRKDYDIPSGDDLFLLRAMELNGKLIQASSHSNVQVISPSASSFKELLQQRQRWFGKMGKLLKPRSIFPLILLISAQVAFVLGVVLSFVNPLFLLLLLFKFVAELLASWSFVKQSGLHIWVLLIHQFWYPVFCLLLLFPIKKEDRWQN
jgi:glycosyltransferase involved in cell wall biosynthesis